MGKPWQSRRPVAELQLASAVAAVQPWDTSRVVSAVSNAEGSAAENRHKASSLGEVTRYVSGLAVAEEVVSAWRWQRWTVRKAPKCTGSAGLLHRGVSHLEMISAASAGLDDSQASDDSTGTGKAWERVGKKRRAPLTMR